jgi:hypothetical protein
MNLLADESVDQPVIDCLRQDGHVVLAVTEMELSIFRRSRVDHGQPAQSLALDGG